MATEPKLLVDAAAAAVSTGVYAYVGRLVLRRPSSTPDARRALVHFAAWWISLAVVTGVEAVRSGLGAWGVFDPALHATLLYVSLLPLAAGLWGLVSYLLYVHAGHRRYQPVVTLAHLGLGVFLVWLVVHLGPVGAASRGWRVEVLFERELTGLLEGVASAAILVPVLTVALAYASLLARTRDPTARFRIAFVSGAFLLWFGSSAIAAGTGLAAEPWWPLASRGIGLVSTALVLFAFQPPGRVRDRLAAASAARAAGDDADDDRRPRARSWDAPARPPLGAA